MKRKAGKVFLMILIVLCLALTFVACGSGTTGQPPASDQPGTEQPGTEQPGPGEQDPTPGGQDPTPGESTTVTVTFVQDGQQNIVKSATRGGTLTDVPVPTPVTGYDATWDRSDFSDLTADLTVNAVLTPKTYKVFFDYGILKDSVNIANRKTEQDVAYGSKLVLPIPEDNTGEYVFDGFLIQGTQEKISDDYTFLHTENITVVAQWKREWSSIYR